jgi:hypothetical protein
LLSIRQQIGCSMLALALFGVAPSSGMSAGGSVLAPKAWVGSWLIAKDLGAPGISALTEAQAHAMLGRAVVITDGRARFAGDNCDNATFEVTEQSIDDFLWGYKLTNAQLPLHGDAARTLEVSCQNAPFHDLSRLDSGCMILVWEGHFFSVANQDTQAPPACLK